nr:LOW QUALITY PROTEIN: uncharacterized protein LOC115120858 [Oncorhynchus nerka]
MGNKNSLLSQDINFKVASELLMKLSESNKDAAHYQKVTVKAEPMEVDPASGPAPPPTHLLAFSTLGVCEKSEPMTSLPEALSRPQKQDLFSQDISVKMASELLFQLSEKVSKANDHKDGNMVGISSPFLDERFRQSPFSQRSKSSSPAEASSSARTALHDPEKDTGEPGGNGMSQGILSSQQLHPCPVCGKVFGRQQTLSRHLSLHTEERKYTCHLCPYAAKCRANLNQHLTIHSVKLVSTDAEQMVSAVAAEGRDGKTFPYYYSACDYVCVEESDMKSPSVNGHTGDPMVHFLNSMMMIVTMMTTMLMMLMMIDSWPLFFLGLNSRSPLSETKSTSSSLSALSDSLNSSEGGELTHANEELKNLLAPPSSAGSQSSSSSHSGSGTEEKSEKGFECVFCNFVCKTRTMYERHLQIHLITRMFECDVCHKFLKTPEQLLEHKKCHTVPTGGLKCPVCIYSTNRPAAMECHLKTHYKMEYKCRICQSVWCDQPALERHVREHRLGNHYKCEQCGYLSKTANKLIEHVRVHTGERPFHCDRCGYSCKRKDNLNLHKKLKHAPRQTFGCTECPFTTTHPSSSAATSRSTRALQSVALSLITGKQHHRQQELPPPAQRYLTTTNGGGPSLFFPSPRHVYEHLERPLVAQPGETTGCPAWRDHWLPSLERPLVAQPGETLVASLERPLVAQPGETTGCPAWRDHWLPSLERPLVAQPGETTGCPAWRDHWFPSLERPLVSQPGETTGFPAWRDHWFPSLERPLVAQPGETTGFPAWRDHWLPSLERPLVAQPGETTGCPAWRDHWLPSLERPLVAQPGEDHWLPSLERPLVAQPGETTGCPAWRDHWFPSLERPLVSQPGETTGCPAWRDHWLPSLERPLVAQPGETTGCPAWRDHWLPSLERPLVDQHGETTGKTLIIETGKRAAGPGERDG